MCAFESNYILKMSTFVTETFASLTSIALLATLCPKSLTGMSRWAERT